LKVTEMFARGIAFSKRNWMRLGKCMKVSRSIMYESKSFDGQVETRRYDQRTRRGIRGRMKEA